MNISFSTNKTFVDKVFVDFFKDLKLFNFDGYSVETTLFFWSYPINLSPNFVNTYVIECICKYTLK
jgi:hypothetical protein